MQCSSEPQEPSCACLVLGHLYPFLSFYIISFATMLTIAISLVSHRHGIHLVLYYIASYLFVSIYILDYLSSLVYKCSKLRAHGVRLISRGGIVEAAAGIISTGGFVREEGSGGR